MLTAIKETVFEIIIRNTKGIGQYFSITGLYLNERAYIRKRLKVQIVVHGDIIIHRLELTS
jgi:hypothetical protein